MAFVSYCVWIIVFISALPFQCSCSSSGNALSLSAENPHDVVKSTNGMFSAGFYAVGENAFSFAIWFTEPHGKDLTVIWMANRDQPVNGVGSTLTLYDTGNLVLNDAGYLDVWATNTTSATSPQLILNNNGNLVLYESNDGGTGVVLWQSFDYPTDTLVPGQHLTRYTNLVSSRSQTNCSSGFYKLFFDNDNVLRLLYDGPDVSSVYWPNPWLVNWDAGRSSYNATRIAVLDSYGIFNSTDDFTFMTSDYGPVLQRRLAIDYDGNVRVYSRSNWGEKWYVSWEAKSEPCMIHGICGANSVCTYDPYSGTKCSCLPGYRVKNESDWSFGCEPKFHLSCNSTESHFLHISNAEFYGYDIGYFSNYTYNQCKDLCLKFCDCKGFQYSFDLASGSYLCYTKTLLLNGYLSPGFRGSIYLRLPKASSFDFEESIMKCNDVNIVNLERVYASGHGKVIVKAFLWLVLGIGVFEIVCIFLVWCLLIRTQTKPDANGHNYHLAATGFKNYTYSELKEATRGFNEEIGRGAGGIVYKGVLSDQRVAAIKRLNEAANQGESEFLAEVNIIGKLNHMNLIDMWGYCVEGKHRLLVYEYMENGSLAENLVSSNSLDWRKRYDIALGTAKGLAYLHEECLEWILHCDIKPQNILLDSNYQPKVADFGLSKLLNRNDQNNSSFSRIRGTRGYMAPEWVFNQPITSKVDVYSYGIVVLEMITGKSLHDFQTVDNEELHRGRLVTWVREKKNRGNEMTSWVEQIIDPKTEGSYDINKMETLAKLALDCVKEEKDARPTMSQVVEMLQSHDADSQ